MKKIVLAICLMLAACIPALAQSCPAPAFAYGQVLTAAQWNQQFACKQAALGYTPVNKAGDTMNGKLVTSIPTTSSAGFSLPSGVAPTTPVNGDIFATATGLYYQLNNASINLTANATTQQSANVVYAGPTSGSAAIPTFRALVAADLPTITTLGTVTAGTWNANLIGAAYGGTGVNNGTNTITLGGSIIATGTGPTTLAVPSSTATFTFPSASKTLMASDFSNAITIPGAIFPALTGDITTPGASLATTLATVNSNVGSFGSSSAIPVVTVDGKGRITAVSTAASASANYALASGLVNKFRNGTFDVWQRGITALATSTTGAYTADGWRVKQTGAAFTVSQDTGTRGTLFSLKAVGGTSNTDTVIGQRIESSVAAPLAGNTITVQFWFKQDTGGSITPKVSTCYASTTDNFSTCTADLALTSLSACATATWCQEAYTFSASASASQGYEIDFDCNTALTSSQHCWAATADVRASPGIATGINASPATPELRPIGIEMPFNFRYFEVQTAPITNGWPRASILIGASASSANGTLTYELKRSVPTITFNAASNFGATQPGVGTATLSSISASNAGTNTALLTVGGTGLAISTSFILTSVGSAAAPQVTFNSEL